MDWLEVTGGQDVSNGLTKTKVKCMSRLWIIRVWNTIRIHIYNFSVTTYSSPRRGYPGRTINRRESL